SPMRRRSPLGFWIWEFREDSRLDRRQLEIAEGHDAVVALVQDGARGRLLAREAARGGSLHLQVLVDDLAVELDLHELRVRGLLAVRVELRRPEVDDELLPLA